MKNPAPTWLTHEIVCTSQGFFGLTRKGGRTPGLVAASSDEFVTHSPKPPPILTVRDTSLRRIRYTHPATADADEFLTSEFRRPPGVSGFLYLHRWALEKVFDELKNKLGPRAPCSFGKGA
jgi:hypothetical protein